jgi:MFS superfamily sulfate permease-like transporter
MPADRPDFSGRTVGALYTSVVFINVSTTGALSVAAGEALSNIHADARLQALATLLLMIGVVQLAFGLLRFGRLVRFISHAVMTGFVTGVAVLIVLGSIPDLTRYQSPRSTPLLRLADTALNWRSLDAWTLVFGIVTVVLISAFPPSPSPSSASSGAQASARATPIRVANSRSPRALLSGRRQARAWCFCSVTSTISEAR